MYLFKMYRNNRANRDSRLTMIDMISFDRPLLRFDTFATDSARTGHRWWIKIARNAEWHRRAMTNRSRPDSERHATRHDATHGAMRDKDGVVSRDSMRTESHIIKRYVRSVRAIFSSLFIYLKSKYQKNYLRWWPRMKTDDLLSDGILWMDLESSARW